MRAVILPSLEIQERPDPVPGRGEAGMAFALALLLAACGGRGAPPPGAATDSAGIAIVTSAAPDSVITPAPRWTVGGEGSPLLDVTDLAVRDDGTLLVANSGSAEVLAFGADGTLRWRFGRKGAGPGEFQRALSVAAIGDTAFAYEFGIGRLTVIGPDGALLRTLQLDLDGPNTELRGAFDDGSLLLAARFFKQMQPGLNRDSLVLSRVSATGLPLGSSGWMHSSMVDFVLADLGPNLHDQAFGAVASVATAGPWLARATGLAAEVRLGGSNGAVRRIVRWNESGAPVDDDARARYRAVRLGEAGTEMERRMVEEWLDHATFAATVPLVGALAVGRDGRLAVAGYCGAGATGCDWRLFAAAGRWVRTLRLPRRSERAVLDGDLLVTLSVDDDGTERLEAWDW